jgi:immune inhibitor A
VRHTVHAGRRRGYSLVAAGSLVVGGFIATGPAQAAPPDEGGTASATHDSDNLRPPQAVKQDALRQQALQKRLKGDKSAQGKVAKLGPGQYVQLDREGTDKIFVVIVEFGDDQYPDPRFQGPPPDGSTTDVTGPRHNEIPAPDRTVDNSTLWQADYNRPHYEDMYFNRMKKYYETQSSGRYSVEGTVTDWVKVPFNEALYGRNYCGGIVCNTSKALVRDALAVWVQAQLDSGQTMAQVEAYLRTFDQQDRYDSDGDGNFNEPDGVIDHFQIVHAGGDEAAGDPNQGTDAIWSHRSGANLQLGGPLGVGVNIGSNGGIVSSSKVPNNPTGVWVYDYTMQPENGGLGVFAHEFGHDLGLPDLYDTSGNTGGAENNTAFWTLMSSGANIGNGGPDGIGDAPTDLGVWEKLQLGWLSAQGDKGPFYEVARAGQRSTHKLGPNTPATKSPEAVFVLLPDKKRIDDVGVPASGSQFFYSGQGNEFTHTMTKTTGITAGTFTAKVRYSTEKDFDYAFLESSTDGGAHWSPVLTDKSSITDPNSNNPSHTGITGESTNFGTGAYVDLASKAPLPPGTNALRWRYTTDPAVIGYGIAVDDMAINGTAIGNAESDEGWAFDGFIRTTGKAESFHFNAYVLENRQYEGYDASLRTAYNFGFLSTRPDWVESYPYQDGLLVSYWDESFGDNNVGEHPGGGLILPVDAHPDLSHWPNGTLVRNRAMSADSTFGLEATDAITLHDNGVALTIPSKPAVRVFDDTRSWWSNCDAHGCTGAHPGRYQPGWYGVDVPKTGTTVTVNGLANGDHLNITVAPK